MAKSKSKISISAGSLLRSTKIAGMVLFVLLFCGILTPKRLPARQSGTMTGHVKDAKTQQPLIGANVVVLGTQRGASTDTTGRFVIRNLPPGSYRLRISYIGYETLIKPDIVVTTGAPALVSASLVPAAVMGESITVSAGYFVDPELAPVSKVTLSREEVRRFPGGFEDVVRTAATLPGVAVVNEGGRNDLLVRGGGPSENLYVVNGFEVPNINHFGSQGSSSGALSFVNLDFVEQIEFSTGGFGAAYGDKMSSVLAIDFRPGRSDRPGGKATISATQFGLDLEGPLAQKGSFLLSARRSYLDFLFKALGQPFVPVYSDFNAFATFDLGSNSELSFIGLAALDRVERNQSTEENRVTNAGIMGNAQDQLIIGMKYRRLYRKGFVDIVLNRNFTRFRFNQSDTSEVEYFRNDSREQELALKVQTYYQFTAAVSLSAGVQLRRVSTDYDIAFADTVYDRSGRRVPAAALDLPAHLRVDNAGYKSASFVELETRAGRLDLRLGLRLDYYGFLARSFYPTLRAAVAFRASDRLRVQASAGRYVQAPSLIWLANPANSDLDALRNDMLVAGGNLLLRDDTRLSLEAYIKRYTDLPAGATAATSYLVLSNAGVGFGGREDDFQSFGFIPLRSQGTGRAYGFELSLQKKYSDTPLYGQISLAVSKSEVTAANGRTYPGQFDQRVIVNVSGGYKFGRGWEVSGKFRLFSGAPYTPAYLPAENDGRVQNLPEEYLAARLPLSHTLDFRLERHLNFRRWSLILYTDVQNLYNNRLPVRPQYDFWERKIIDRATLGVLPSIGVSAVF